MHLFRRFLLCLVVGVTAFGAAGWMALPTPNWTVEIGAEGIAPTVVKPQTGTVDPAAPIWLNSQLREIPLHTMPPVYEWTIEARDSDDGRLLKRIPKCRGMFVIAGSSNELLVVDYDDLEQDGRIKKVDTIVNVFDARSAGASKTFKLPNQWLPANDGLHVWTSHSDDKGWRVSVADLMTGEILRTKVFPEYVEQVVAGSWISHDGRLVALSERMCRDRKGPFGIDVYDVESGERKWRVVPPIVDAAKSVAYADGPRFSDDGHFLTFNWNEKDLDETPSQWRVDLRTGRYQRYPLPPPFPLPFESLTHEDANLGRWRRGVWLAHDPASNRDWICLENHDGEWFPWRMSPFPLNRVWSSADPPVTLIPQRRELVAATKESPPNRLIPESLRRFGPDSWMEQEFVARQRWYDWRRDKWLDVGCGPNVVSIQARANTLIATSKLEDDRIFLQSWPLPPRDPKWPALGIAAASMAGTWWGCAKRYRRRIERAAIPSVIA